MRVFLETRKEREGWWQRDTNSRCGGCVGPVCLIFGVFVDRRKGGREGDKVVKRRRREGDGGVKVS